MMHSAILRENVGPDDQKNLLSLEIDIRSNLVIKSVAGQRLAKFGHIDVLVNNAGYAHVDI
jgi:NADP-dependent 3-hydroxy acid dehydrogenase YdfG